MNDQEEIAHVGDLLWRDKLMTMHDAETGKEKDIPGKTKNKNKKKLWSSEKT